MGLNFFKIIQKIESAFMFILLHGGLETIILFVFGEELYNKYKINNNKNNIGMSRKKDKVKGILFVKKTGKLPGCRCRMRSGSVWETKRSRRKQKGADITAKN